MMDFPSAPTSGQTYAGYKWDGAKWTCQTAPLPMGDSPSDTNPLVNGVNIPGLSTKYSRGDHVHPTDTSRAPPNNTTLTGAPTGAAANITSNMNVTGTFTGLAKSHYLGTASGSSNPPQKAEANIILYDAGGDNWAGMGSDSGGGWWLRTGLSGTPNPAIYIDQARNTSFIKPPVAPTPAAGDNSTLAATTNFVLSNPATGPYLPLTGGVVTGLMYVNGDLRTYRADNTGVIYLGNTGARYLYNNLAGFHLAGAHANTAAGRLWGNGDFPTPIVNIRLAYVGDQQLGSSDTTLHEDYGGSVVTGKDGHWNGGSLTRYRQFQIQLGPTWYAVGYA